MYPHLAQLKMVFVSKLTHVSAMTSHRMPLRTPDHSIVRPPMQICIAICISHHPDSRRVRENPSII